MTKILIGLTTLLSLFSKSSLAFTKELKVGDTAPAFALPGSDGKKYELKTLQGKKVVLYFYPKDQTPGCTKEACAFRDRNQEILDKGAVVFGINTDTVESHKKFVEKYELTFPLLADPEAKVVKAYGAAGALGFAKRITYIIDSQGKIAQVYPKVQVEKHVEEVLADLDKTN